MARLLAELDADPNWRWLELTGSGAADCLDEWSDLDCGAGALDPVAALASVNALLDRVEPVVDRQRQAFGVSATHVVCLFAGGVQLSLVVFGAADRPGLPPLSAALLDKDGTLGSPWTPSSYAATPSDLREWCYLGWQALLDLGKCLDRGELWKARGRIEEARAMLLRLWAYRCGEPYPVFGLLPEEPSWLASTLADLSYDSLLAAGHALAGLFDQFGPAIPLAAAVRTRVFS